MFKYIIAVLVLILTITRLLETVLPDVSKKKGKIYAKWLFYCLLVCGIAIYISGVTEFVISVKEINLPVSILGIVLLSLKMVLKYRSMKALGKFWSIQIELRKGQTVIREGPYKYVRHPAYASTIIEVIGGLLLVNAYYSLLLACIIYFPLIIIRIVLEERNLLGELGDGYMKYQKEVPMLLPYKMFNQKAEE
ncbi:MAG: hypothetical protein A2231_11105 [Candidatus Firestonebacteria bacterium RIFOXYA2_FULL_40_8]|nr:MAG: hypothetical protein A2231_11105 [Candidatus Firestonebacteria bacterium RIFOXYA2_FULL_40_8]